MSVVVNAPAVVASVAALFIISTGAVNRYRHMNATQENTASVQKENLRLWTTIFPGLS
jgi:hypothetical protein